MLVFPALAQTTLQVNTSPQVISGQETAAGVQFRSELLPSGHDVLIDMYFGNKRIHAEINYRTHRVVVQSTFVANARLAALSVDDIIRFQKLLVSLGPVIGAEMQHADALGSLVSFVASFPRDNPLNFDIAPPAAEFHSICALIDQQSTATYKLCADLTTCHETRALVPHVDNVTVGPVCYVPPALGRCGAGGGPDPAIGWAQRFTQECLNHDQCCEATINRIIKGVNVCGHDGTNECVKEAGAALPGLLFAPDCGTTAGQWTDNFGYVYDLTGGIGALNLKPFSGTVTTTIPECPTWKVDGMRKGKTISLTAENLASERKTCAGSYRYIGTYSDCSAASGTWTNSSGLSGTWSWTRNGSVPPVVPHVLASVHSPAAKK